MKIQDRSPVRPGEPQPAPSEVAKGEGSFAQRMDEASAAEAAREASEAMEREDAEAYQGPSSFFSGDGGDDEDEHSREKRKAMQERRKLALAALENAPLLSPQQRRSSGSSASAPRELPDLALQTIVDDVTYCVRDKNHATHELQIRLKDNALQGLQLRVRVSPEGVQILFLSDSTELRSLLMREMDRLTKALRDKGLILEQLEVRDPQEEERQRKRQEAHRDRQQAQDEPSPDAAAQSDE